VCHNHPNRIHSQNGHTALDVAISSGHVELVKLLRSAQDFAAEEGKREEKERLALEQQQRVAQERERLEQQRLARERERLEQHRRLEAKQQVLPFFFFKFLRRAEQRARELTSPLCPFVCGLLRLRDRFAF
jgi:ankyrin repeat protein